MELNDSKKKKKFIKWKGWNVKLSLHSPLVTWEDEKEKRNFV
jgi:hypothetical protein